jgi:hypothetical protein
MYVKSSHCAPVCKKTNGASLVVWSKVLISDILGYMNTQTPQHTDWWHERPTKAADLGTKPASLYPPRNETDPVWFKAAVTVGLVFALGLSLIALAGR